ncbi:unnamed protein product [Clavelina lepadiformis]|uniref:C2H2-type domain-containing protein n=1 Tax=Clavelina lepadiformis TaxID=159417 RepID=A0ABP0FZY5_CLALP
MKSTFSGHSVLGEAALRYKTHESQQQIPQGLWQYYLQHALQVSDTSQLYQRLGFRNLFPWGLGVPQNGKLGSCPMIFPSQFKPHEFPGIDHRLLATGPSPITQYFSGGVASTPNTGYCPEKCDLSCKTFGKLHKQTPHVYSAFSLAEKEFVRKSNPRDPAVMSPNLEQCYPGGLCLPFPRAPFSGNYLSERSKKEDNLRNEVSTFNLISFNSARNLGDRKVGTAQRTAESIIRPQTQPWFPNALIRNDLEKTVTALKSETMIQTKSDPQSTNSLKVRTHQCFYCGKLYSRKYGLKIHIRTHTGYKPLKCKVCSRPFGDPSNLNKHVRLHAIGDTPYKCEFCGKVLVRRRDLERHVKSRHPEIASACAKDAVKCPPADPRLWTA